MSDEKDQNIKLPIEQSANNSWTLSNALVEMAEYRNWEESTYKSYQSDAEAFEDFCYQEGFEPTLENIFLHHVDKWIKKSYEQKVAFNTIKRRIAALSGLYSFYQGIGTIKHNPFKACDIPVGTVGHFSRDLELKEIVDVYEAIQILKKEEGKDVGVTMKVLFNTGLRGHALAKIKVKDVWLDKALIYYDAGIVNSKHVIQFFPIPPRLLEELKNHIEEYNLEPGDQLLHGLGGLPLRQEQINRLTNRINKVLGWEGDKHVTPHGYRASIASILHERGMELDNIKYLLGHAITKDNIHFYLRRDQRKIRALRSELTAIENELYEGLKKRQTNGSDNNSNEVLNIEENTHTLQQTSNENTITIQEFIELTKTNPKLAQKLAAMNLVSM